MDPSQDSGAADKVVEKGGRGKKAKVEAQLAGPSYKVTDKVDTIKEIDWTQLMIDRELKHGQVCCALPSAPCASCWSVYRQSIVCLMG